jgi:flagellar FliL protein
MKSKILIIGLPLFVVQLVVVYFITANILISQNNSSAKENKEKDTTVAEAKTNGEEPKTEETQENKDDAGDKKNVGQHLFTLEDVICNPAETNGKILVLTSLGFDMNSAESKKIMEEKTVILKDVVLNTIAKKTVAELSNVSKRDSLKIEIIKNVEAKLPKVKINDLYFSKFIIQ